MKEMIAAGSIHFNERGKRVMHIRGRKMISPNVSVIRNEVRPLPPPPLFKDRS